MQLQTHRNSRNIFKGCSGGGGVGGGGLYFVCYNVRYVSRERPPPPFSTLNFSSGAYHYFIKKIGQKLFFLDHSPFLVARQICYIFAVPETIAYKISFRSSRYFSYTLQFIAARGQPECQPDVHPCATHAHF